jgi:hypothetical protein
MRHLEKKRGARAEKHNGLPVHAPYRGVAPKETLHGIAHGMGGGF